MLAKIFRLSKQSDFKNVFSNGRKVFGKVFNIRFLPNLEKSSRISVIVSNKISKKATARNLIKRRVREIIRKILPKLKQNYDIIITVLSPASSLDFHQLESEVVSGFKKSNLI